MYNMEIINKLSKKHHPRAAVLAGKKNSQGEWWGTYQTKMGEFNIFYEIISVVG